MPLRQQPAQFLMYVNTGLLLAILNYSNTIEHRITALETAQRLKQDAPAAVQRERNFTLDTRHKKPRIITAVAR